MSVNRARSELAKRVLEAVSKETAETNKKFFDNLPPSAAKRSKEALVKSAEEKGKDFDKIAQRAKKKNEQDLAELSLQTMQSAAGKTADRIDVLNRLKTKAQSDSEKHKKKGNKASSQAARRSSEDFKSKRKKEAQRLKKIMKRTPII